MKILLIGAGGQLGCDICKVIPREELIPLTIKDLDITDKKQTSELIKSYQPNVVINTAAYNQVDQAEKEPDKAFAINDIGAQNVAQACRENNALMVHFSTDYVFDGESKRPYIETDMPNPKSIYGKSKLAGELKVKETLADNKYILIRSAGLFGTAGCMGKGGSNFVENIINKAQKEKLLSVVDFEVVSPTYTYDLARKIHELIMAREYGLFHIVNHGKCTWYGFAHEIFGLMKIDIRIEPLKIENYVSKGASRPRFSALQNARLAELGMDDLRDWKEALKAYLAERK